MTIFNEVDQKHTGLSEILTTIEASGFYPIEVIPDGKIHRFPRDQADRGKSAWYIVHQTSHRNGTVFFVAVWGDWREGIEPHRFQSNRRDLSPEEREEIQQKIEEAKRLQKVVIERQREETAQEAERKWNSLSEDLKPDYLKQKQLHGSLFGCKAQADSAGRGVSLYVPVRDHEGKIWSLQKIESSGQKLFLPGGKKSGNFHIIGEIQEDKPILIVEGLATGASVHLATDLTVIIAFDAGNLLPVARSFRKRYPKHAILICGDDDQFTENGNAGRIKSTECARTMDGCAVFPRFNDLSSKPTDFNDLHCLEGLDAVRIQISDALPNLFSPKEEEETKQLYNIANGSIVWNRQTSEGPRSIPLCNFSARISREELHDDGVERRVEFIIEGRSNKGREFPHATVSSEKYSGMTWVNSNWGTRAIVYAGQNTKDHLRVAIQTLSADVPQHTVFTHIGWRNFSGKWFYLHAGGAIGENGLDQNIQVSMDDRLKHYLMPSPPCESELQTAIQASLRLLKLAPLRITAPLLAGIYRAPLGHASDIDFSLFLTGPSGCQKSELSAIVQRHFGQGFKRTNLPGNWSSTGNALERQAFLAKDAIFTVDDFAPNGSAMDVAKLNKEADRLLRGQGNKAGRGRLSADAKSRPQYFPRGLIISSGEDVPRGPSLRARALILEMAPGDTNLDCLTTIQSHADQGLLVKAMAGYIKWLSPQMDSLIERLPVYQREMRAKVRLGTSHARTPDLVISLGLGLEIFLQYAYENHAITEKEKHTVWEQSWEAIQDSGGRQREFQEAEEPALKFLDLLRTAIISGRAHLADAKTGSTPYQPEKFGWRPEGVIIREAGEPEPDHWRPMGDRIGWVSANEILLSPGAVYGCIHEVARRQNDTMPVSERTLWKRLAQRGIILKEEANKNTCKRPIMGDRPRVLVIPNWETLSSSKNGGNGDNRDTSAPAVLERPQ